MKKSELENMVRLKYLEQITTMLEANNEEVYKFENNAICFPTLDAENNEIFVQIFVKIPKGDRSGEPFDGYTAAKMYEEKVEEQRKKDEEKAKKKAEKIKKDTEARKKLAESKAKAKAEKEQAE